MVFRGSRSYSGAMFFLAGLLFLALGLTLGGVFQTDLLFGVIAFCVFGGLFLLLVGLVVLCGTTTLDPSGVTITFWFRKIVMPWDSIDFWMIREELSGDFKGKRSVRFNVKSASSVVVVFDYEVDRPGFSAFVEEIRRYAPSKEQVDRSLPHLTANER